MELKPRYKQTEVGVLPEDWTVQVLGEGINLFSGCHVLANNCNTEGRGKPYITGPADFPEGVIKSSKFTEKPTTLCQDGDILVTVKGSGAGMIVKADGEYCISRQLMAIRPKAWDANYLYLSLQSKASLFGAAATGLIPGLSRADILSKQLPLPPVPEQRSIATTLSDMDELLGACDRLISKKRDLKQAAMQQLLSPDASWTSVELEKVADVIDPHPSHRAPNAVSSGIPFVGIGDLSEDGEIIGTKIRLVDASVYEEHRARYDLSEELIGLGRVASIGKVVRLKPTSDKYVISPTLGIIRATAVKREFLLYSLRSKYVTEQFTKIMSGSTRSSVGMVVLRKLEVALPPTPEEQTAIATILSDMDAEIATLEQRRAKTRALKQGMMQELLTGRIRLV